MSKMLGDESEVVFDQPEEKAGATEPDGSVPNRRKEALPRSLTMGPDPEQRNSTGRSIKHWVPLQVD